MTHNKNSNERRGINTVSSQQDAQLEDSLWSTKKSNLECQKLQLEITRLQNESLIIPSILFVVACRFWVAGILLT